MKYNILPNRLGLLGGRLWCFIILCYCRGGSFREFLGRLKKNCVWPKTCGIRRCPFCIFDILVAVNFGRRSLICNIFWAKRYQNGPDKSFDNGFHAIRNVRLICITLRWCSSEQNRWNALRALHLDLDIILEPILFHLFYLFGRLIIVFISFQLQ